MRGDIFGGNKYLCYTLLTLKYFMYEFYLFTFWITSAIFGFFYFLWRKSSYRLRSSFGFWGVHAWLLLEDSSWILRNIFKNYLWLYGEYSIYQKLERINWYGKIFINLYLPQWETVTDTEVDLIFIHQSWIYVIESKDYRGWIFGNSHDTQWTQSFSKWAKFRFYNPIRQNYSHIKSLEKLIPEYKNYIKWMVVFSNRSSFKKISCPNETVIHTNSISNEISENVILWESDVSNISNILMKYSKHSSEQEILHTHEILILKSPPLS